VESNFYKLKSFAGLHCQPGGIFLADNEDGILDFVLVGCRQVCISDRQGYSITDLCVFRRRNEVNGDLLFAVSNWHLAVCTDAPLGGAEDSEMEEVCQKMQELLQAGAQNIPWLA
jgi:hypothetical protein